MPKPTEGTFPTYFATYINKVMEDNIADAFKNQKAIANDFFESISEEKSNYTYAPGKWTLKQMLQHFIDAERIFAYRALSIARKETQSLPGFVRKTTELLFEIFSEDILNQSGISNNNAVTVNALGFITVGYMYHNVEVIKERYL